jgi:hypothetical protein
MRMRFVPKTTVPLLTLLLVALPVMACVQPGIVMTAAERACCKQMAQQCRESGMAKSHDCCHTQVSRMDWHAPQSSSNLNHVLTGSQGQPVVDENIGNPPIVFDWNAVSFSDSPPGLSHFSTTILRI